MLFILKLPHATTHSQEGFGRNTSPIYTCSSNYVPFDDSSFQALQRSLSNYAQYSLEKETEPSSSTQELLMLSRLQRSHNEISENYRSEIDVSQEFTLQQASPRHIVYFFSLPLVIHLFIEFIQPSYCHFYFEIPCHQSNRIHAFYK